MFTTWDRISNKLSKTCDKEELISLLASTLDYYENKAKTATERAERTKDEVRSEVMNEYARENAELHERLKLSFGSFNFSEEMQRYKRFCDKHASCRLISKINGGKIPYVKVYCTGIGSTYTVVCPVCGEEEDITYIDGW